MAFPSSMGFGHGKFGKGPCGNGPWVTMPHTPGFATGEDQGHEVLVAQFGDLTEQRFLLGRKRDVRLTYEWTTADSATVEGMNSWFLATYGPATRFRATDHRTGLDQVVRFGEPTFQTTRGAVDRAIPPVVFQVQRPITYAETIAVDSPAGYFRLPGASGSAAAYIDWTGANTYDATGGVAGVAQATDGPLRGDRLVPGAWHFDGRSGGLMVNSAGTGTTLDVGGSWWVCEVWFRTTMTGRGVIYRKSDDGNQGGVTIDIGAAGPGRLRIFVNSNVANFVQQTSLAYNDGLWHYAAFTVRRVPSNLGNIWVDQTLVTSGPYSGLGAAVFSCTARPTIGWDATSAAFYQGDLAELAIYKNHEWDSGVVRRRVLTATRVV